MKTETHTAVTLDEREPLLSGDIGTKQAPADIDDHLGCRSLEDDPMPTTSARGGQYP